MSTQRSSSVPARTLLFLVIIALALYVLLPQVGSFRDSFKALHHAESGWLLIAGSCAVLTYMAAAATYCIVALKPISYIRMLTVQLASAFANRLLPAGIGGIGVNYRFLRHEHHTPTQSASVVTANNTIGFLGHVVILLITLITEHNHLPSLHIWRGRLLAIAFAGLIVAGITFVFLSRRLQQRILHAFRGLLKQLADYRLRLGHVCAALLTSIGLTLSYVLGLWACCFALGLELPFLTVLLVFTLAVAVGTATPTPGGLGGIEAGLVAGFVANEVAGATALAVVLAYRGLTYWMPLFIGIPAFVVTERRGYYSIAGKQ